MSEPKNIAEWTADLVAKEVAKDPFGYIAERIANCCDDTDVGSLSEEVRGYAPPAAGPWIPVTERLPERDGPCLLMTEFHPWFGGFVRGKFEPLQDGDGGIELRVTHWAEIRGPK